MGKFDFVPRVLEKLGVNKVFHKVSQRPGKPLWFGSKGQKTVFGLPGNPVSAVINFQRYILPQLQKSCGTSPHKQIPLATLTKDFEFSKKMTRFLPVTTYFDANSRLCASPKETNGSGDFGALSGSDGFLELEAETDFFPKAYSAPFYTW